MDEKIEERVEQILAEKIKEAKQARNELEQTNNEVKEANDVTKQTVDGEKLNENIEKQETKFDSPRILGLHEIKRTFSKEIEVTQTKFYRGSLRSGQKIEFEGSLVILGDVNSGAEVLAGENIAIIGALRGIAHAGAKGNREAIIFASSIEAPQIRIANIVKEIEREEFEKKAKTYAYVNNENRIVLE